MPNLSDLVVKYPELFTNSEGEPFTLFGFECDDKWYHLLNSCFCVLYSNYERELRTCDYMYRQTLFTGFNYKTGSIQTKANICSVLDKMRIERNKLPKIAQVKEKFGSLVIHADNYTELLSKLCLMINLLGEHMCGRCGQPIDHRRNRIGMCRSCFQTFSNTNSIEYNI